MISGLIDELNKSADEWNGSNMFELARMCRNAADTICELRGALQVASVDYRHLSEENAKLLDELDAAKHDLSLFSERIVELGADNAKLRELVSGVHMAYVGTLNECESLNEGLIYEYSGSVEADVAKSRAKFKADRHRFDAALHELGVEVDA